ncbi:MAG: hypothetical protein JWP47_3248 [Polaromonas sp.]|jgi:hypothetical protein|nr:hypothetical protein [Polaromonas sp.]
MRWISAWLILPLTVMAQTPAPTEFPAEATPLAGTELQARIAGKAFNAKPADGNGWRTQYNANGYAFLDTSRGYRDTGSWRVEKNTLCVNWQKLPSGCNEVRAIEGSLYLKRVSGEVVRLTAE